MSEKIKGTEAMCRALGVENIDTLFGYPGGAIMAFYDTLLDHPELRHILVRHEQGAIHAAQGYARASGRTGVVCVTSGPGATNVITGLGDAIIDSTPVVVLTGQVNVGSLGTDAFQETDVVGITQPITKWAYQIRSAEEIPWAVARAFYIASTGRPGPVVLDFTKDAQLGMVEWNYSKINYIRSYNPDPDLNSEILAEAVEAINASKRPLILAGHGVMISHAEADLLAFAEKADIPVATTLLGISAIPTDHPLSVGMVGMHGNIAPNIKTNEADLIIAVGMRFDDRVTGRIDSYAPNARIIQIDVDASEFNKNLFTHIHVHADAGRALRALLPQVVDTRHTEWRESFAHADAVERSEVMARELAPAPDGRMHMGQVVATVARLAPEGSIAVTDVGQNQMFAARYFRHTHSRTFISSGGLGTMGFGLPAAIGAKIGRPDSPVFVFMGDGGFQMTMQELGTVMEFGIPVKIIILNNNFLGNVRQWQSLFFRDRFVATPMLNPDFAAIAAAYGIKGEDVDHTSQLEGAVERMIASDSAYLLNVNIEAEDMVFPMVAPGSAIDDIMLNRNEKYKKP